jgi:amidase
VTRRLNRRSAATMMLSGAGVGLVAALAVLAGPAAPSAQIATWRFQLEEATIDDVHRAIKEGQITCQGLVQAYLNRARAYNGVASQVVTEEMAPKYLPDYDQYKAAVLATASLKDGDPKKTPPIEFGRLEPTASDPAVQQQYGMVVGMPNAGQLRAMGMLNVRGERTVTCKGDRDRHPSKGPLPAGSPAVCEELRKMPDALERAAELDAQFGRNPDLAAMPMYCIPFSFKDPFDTKDMRSTGGGDTRYDIDFPARDQTLVGQLRAKGAIIYAKANTTEYNGRGGNPGGTHFPTKVLPSTLGYQRSTWAGNPSNVYDTTRAASIGSSSGSGVSVGANLVMCSLCEETGASCRGPSNHNSSALILPHKSLISFHGGSIGASIYQDRAGIVCRTVADSAKVLDALKDPVNGYYDPRDIFTTVPRSSVLDGYAKHVAPGTAGSLKGMRIGIVREFMIPHAKADEAIVAAAAKEMKAMLADHLGATLVETVPSGWTDDPAVENMTVDFDRAIAQITPVIYPELLFKLENGTPKFPAFAAKIKPTQFAPGKTFGSGTMQPVDWMMRWAEGTEPGPPNLNVRSVISAAQSRTFRFHLAQYLTRRAQDWKARGFAETVVDWKTLNERSKFWGDDQRAAFLNWGDVEDVRNEAGSAQGIAEQVQLRELLRRVIQKVMAENKLDVMIQLHSALPPGKIGLAPEPSVNDRSPSYSFGPHAGITEMLIPAGYVRVAYDATFELATDANGRKVYRGKAATTPTEIPAPGLPFSINFWAEPGMEHLTLRAASAYQAASKRRVPPPMFGPLKGEPVAPAAPTASARR